MDIQLWNSNEVRKLMFAIFDERNIYEKEIYSQLLYNRLEKDSYM